MQANIAIQATDGFAITPSDVNLISAQADNTNGHKHCTLWSGTGGNISVVFIDGKQVDFTNIPAGVTLPWIVKQVRATNTSATGIKGLIGRFGSAR